MSDDGWLTSRIEYATSIIVNDDDTNNDINDDTNNDFNDINNNNGSIINNNNGSIISDNNESVINDNNGSIISDDNTEMNESVNVDDFININDDDDDDDNGTECSLSSDDFEDVDNKDKDNTAVNHAHNNNNNNNNNNYNNNNNNNNNNDDDDDDDDTDDKMSIDYSSLISVDLLARDFTDIIDIGDDDSEILSLFIPISRNPQKRVTTTINAMISDDGDIDNNNNNDDESDNDDDDDDNNDKPKTQKRNFCYAPSSRSYTQIFAIAGLIAELNYFKKTLSQRDLYYSLKYLFRDQGECDLRLLEFGSLVRLHRYEMGIVPSSKGYFSGHIKYRFRSKTSVASDIDIPWVDCSESSDDQFKAGVNISFGWTAWTEEELEIEVPSSVKYLIVIEKEGIFRRLTQDKFFDRLSSILVTGCGFPDVATKAFVSKVSARYPSITVVGLCDYNPFGLQLLLSYKYISKRTAFESKGFQSNIKWIGLRSSSIDLITSRISPQSFQVMKPIDHKKIITMLATNKYKKYHPELIKMKLRQKLELEALHEISQAYVFDFVYDAITSGDYI